jgi:hypothetical protein
MPNFPHSTVTGEGKKYFAKRIPVGGRPDKLVDTKALKNLIGRA